MDNSIFKSIILLIAVTVLSSCEEFVMVETPNFKMVTESVYENDETAEAALDGIYNRLFVSGNFANGYINSVTVLSGLSSDIFQTTSDTDTRYRPFQQNEISPGETPDANANYELWSSAYNIIYLSNSILEGINNSTNLSDKTKNILEGKALFIRAFTYFYLIQIYGDVPLILSTDYRLNSVPKRNSHENIMQIIIADLNTSLILLEDVTEYKNNERFHINKYVVAAFTARVSLYNRDWAIAESLSTQVINKVNLYEILDDPNLVFLMNSKEAIWQISPVVAGIGFSYTWEGYVYRGNNSSAIKLSKNFIESWGSGDKRLACWIGLNEDSNFYHPLKYKDANSRNNITEYSMVLRLAEQYLIRSESRVMQGDIKGAISDLEVIRTRAGLNPTKDVFPEIGQKEILDILLKERKKELFSEWGHRWFDLKRFGKAGSVLQPLKPNWESTDVYYPIPEAERLKNPNLHQNKGY